MQNCIEVISSGTRGPDGQLRARAGLRRRGAFPRCFQFCRSDDDCPNVGLHRVTSADDERAEGLRRPVRGRLRAVARAEHRMRPADERNGLLPLVGESRRTRSATARSTPCRRTYLCTRSRDCIRGLACVDTRRRAKPTCLQVCRLSDNGSDCPSRRRAAATLTSAIRRARRRTRPTVLLLTDGARGDIGRGAAAVVAARRLRCGGCFKPKIVDGGLLLRRRRPLPGGVSLRRRRHVQGQAARRSASRRRLTSKPICTPEPGNDCDPVCQSRCECGRCTLAGTELTCVPRRRQETRRRLQRRERTTASPGTCACRTATTSSDGATASAARASVRHDELCARTGLRRPRERREQAPDRSLGLPGRRSRRAIPAGDGTDCGNAALALLPRRERRRDRLRMQREEAAGEGCASSIPALPVTVASRSPRINAGAPTCLKTCALAGERLPVGNLQLDRWQRLRVLPRLEAGVRRESRLSSFGLARQPATRLCRASRS